MTDPHALEPCPFCGGEAENLESVGIVSCDTCGGQVSTGDGDSAVDGWNRRAHSAPAAPDRDLWAALMFVKHPDLLRLQIGDELVSREEWIDAVSRRIDGAVPLAPRWMPIATAPKDREILVYTEEDGVFTAIWRDDDWQPSTRGSIAYDSYAEKYTGHGEMYQPTHWCEKPGAPDR